MSVFRVKLNNTQQGKLDKHPTTGAQMSTSKQRTVYVTGPNGVHRQLVDGETFTDSNYYKRFAYPQVSLEDAILEVVTDDGSVYSDVASENTYPKVYDITAAGVSTYEDNQADIATDTGGYAVFTQIKNKSASQAVRVRLNGSASAIFDLDADTTQVFNTGDLAITLVEIDNSDSGATDADIQILVSVKSVNNS